MTDLSWRERAERAEAGLRAVAQRLGIECREDQIDPEQVEGQAVIVQAMRHKFFADRERAEAQVAVLRDAIKRYLACLGKPHRDEYLNDTMFARAKESYAQVVAFVDGAIVETAAAHDAAVTRAAMERCAQIAEHTPCGSLSAEFVRDTIAAAIRAETEKA